MKKTNSKMRQIRFFKGLTLDDIYLLTGRKVAMPKLSRIERGICLPTEEEKRLIAGALKEAVDEIF